MKLYWSIKSIPELATLPAARRKQVWRRQLRQVQKQRSGMIGLILCGVCAGLGSAVGQLPGFGWSGGAIGGAAGGAIGGFILMQIYCRQVSSLLRKAEGTESSP